MRQFRIGRINAFDGKGKAIPGTIKPVHPDYQLESSETQGKLHLFALARRGRKLEQAKSLRLVVTPNTGSPWPAEVRVRVLHADSFGLDQVSSGDYWDDVPESLRLDIQDALADELMNRAKVGIVESIFEAAREPYPYQGVVFIVSELDELEALFPPE